MLDKDHRALLEEIVLNVQNPAVPNGPFVIRLADQARVKLEKDDEEKNAKRGKYEVPGKQGA